MIKRLSRLAPVQFGIVLAATYALLSLIFVPFFLLFALFGAHASQASGQPMAGMFGGGVVVMAVGLPVMYGAFGFIFGVIGALIYNLVAGWTGGIEITLTDVVPPLPTQGSLPPTY